MSLNIKNERTHRLVRELAELEGRTLTSAVEEAVAQRLADLRARGEDRSARIDLTIGRIQAELTAADREALATALQSGGDLYDEAGLPR